LPPHCIQVASDVNDKNRKLINKIDTRPHHQDVGRSRTDLQGPRLGACAHERAVTYMQIPRLQWPLASLTQPSSSSSSSFPEHRTTPLPNHVVSNIIFNSNKEYICSLHPPCEDPAGTHSGRTCQAQLASPRIRIRQSRSRGSVTNPLVAPGELRPARGRSRLGRGIVHVIGGLGRERVGVLRAPPACDFRSAPATPDGVCACLTRSLL